MSPSSIHQKLGTAGFIIAIVALVAALGGGAYAASNALNGKQKKEVEKIAKQYAGKPGAAGATGPAGPAGAKGDNGAPGANGTNGTNGGKGERGEKGEAGEPGESPLGTSFIGPKGPINGVTCTEGGIEYEAGGEINLVCNGKEGALGTAGTTLPVGATETGAWSVAGSGGSLGYAPISFPIKLASPIESPNIHIAGESEFETFCHGSASKPTAPSGSLCVYWVSISEATEPKVMNVELSETEASRAGAFIQWKLGSEPTPGEILSGFASGSFAVTG